MLCWFGEKKKRRGILIRFIHVDNITEEHHLARSVYRAGNPVPLLREGLQLDRSYANSLKTNGISWVYINDPISDGVEVEDIVHDETRVFANTLLAEILSRNPPIINQDIVYRLKAIATMIVADIKEYRPRVSMELWHLKTLEDYLYLHSVNVSVISVMVGWRMGLSPKELEELCIGVLLHDIGKVTVSEKIHNKTGHLTGMEYDEMKQHTRRGFNFLRKLWIFSPIVWSVAHQHHEFFDGSGYPYGRNGKEIHLYSRIAAIIDIFDALTSDRPYKGGWPFHKALKYLTDEVCHRFDKKILSVFVNLVPQFPRGTAVTLSTGEIGIVVENIDDNYHRPVVRVMFDCNGKSLKKGETYDIDLNKEMDIQIKD